MTPTKSALTALLCAAAVVVAAPGASAQGLPSLSDASDGIGDVTDGIGDVTGSAGDAIGDTAGGATEAVDDAAGEVTGGGTPDVGGTVDDTVDEVTGGTPDVGGTVGEITEPITGDEGSGGGGGGSGGGGITGPLTDKVTETVGNVTGGNGTGSGSGGSVGGVVDDLLDGSPRPPDLKDLTTDLIDDLIDGAAAEGISPAAAEGWIEGSRAGSTDPRATRPGGVLGTVATSVTAFAGTLADAYVEASEAQVRLVTEQGDDSFFGAAGRAATTVAKILAFPLVLALLVVAFLAIQGRIGRRDPKLVLAPVDTADEYLSFE